VLKATAILFCSLVVPACTFMPAVRCQVTDDRGEVTATLMPLFPAQHAKLYRITEDRFLDLKYDTFTSSVFVTLLEMPHHPWSFGEHSPGSATLRLDSNAAATGAVSIAALVPGARLECTANAKPPSVKPRVRS
jgi:hypothetical protein